MTWTGEDWAALVLGIILVPVGMGIAYAAAMIRPDFFRVDDDPDNEHGGQGGAPHVALESREKERD